MQVNEKNHVSHFAKERHSSGTAHSPHHAAHTRPHPSHRPLRGTSSCHDVEQRLHLVQARQAIGEVLLGQGTLKTGDSGLHQQHPLCCELAAQKTRVKLAVQGGVAEVTSAAVVGAK
jgi:hypothetical protein